MNKSDNTKINISAGGFACFASPAEDHTVAGVELLPETHAASKGGLGFKIVCQGGDDIIVVADNVGHGNLWRNALKGATAGEEEEDSGSDSADEEAGLTV